MDNPFRHIHPVRAFSLALIGILIGVSLGLCRGGLADGPVTFGDHLLITEVYYNSQMDETLEARGSYGTDEYIRIDNPMETAVDLFGYVIEDNEGSVEFPPLILPPKHHAVLSGNGTAYLRLTGHLPDGEYEVNSSALVPDGFVSTTPPRLGNQGDRIQLRNESVIVDEIVYGGYGGGTTSWTGPNILGVSVGRILRRQPGPFGGWAETNSSTDWRSPGEPRAGQSHFDSEEFKVPVRLTAFVSPDSSYSVLEQTIRSANKTIHAELYEFTNPELAALLAERAEAGVEVFLLLEGSPVGGIQEAEKYSARLVVDSGGKVRFLASDPLTDLGTRYVFLHSKFVVIDGDVLVLGTENWGQTGIPKDPSFGNRGWGIRVESEALASWFEAVFFDDWDPGRFDSIPFAHDSDRFGDPSTTFRPSPSPVGSYVPRHRTFEVRGTYSLKPFLAPDHTFTQDPILELIQGAQDSLLVNQFYITPNWSRSDGRVPNEYLGALVDAARRGVHVKVLLDSFYYNVEPTDSQSNLATLEYLLDLADREALPLEAKLIDLGLSGLEKLHAKGMVVDNRTTLISTINWNYASPARNREVGLILEEASVARYFASVFYADWSWGPQENPPFWQNPYLGVLLVLLGVILLSLWVRRRRSR